MVMLTVKVIEEFALLGQLLVDGLDERWSHYLVVTIVVAGFCRCRRWY